MGEGLAISFNNIVLLQNYGILAPGLVNRVVFSGHFKLAY